MPNWCRNYLSMEGIGEKDYFTDDEFDFGKLIPMPEELNLTSGSITNESIYIYLTNKMQVRYKDLPEQNQRIIQRDCGFFGFDEKRYLDLGKHHSGAEIEKMYADGEKYVRNILQYGAPTWYEWSYDNWGTKWNASGTIITDDHIEFDTAWGPPDGVLTKIVMENPAKLIIHAWMEEGGGSGGFAAKDGKIIYAVSDLRNLYSTEELKEKAEIIADPSFCFDEDFDPGPYFILDIADCGEKIGRQARDFLMDSSMNKETAHDNGFEW